MSAASGHFGLLLAAASGGGPGPATPLIDAVGATETYSWSIARRLKSTFTTALIRVRRSSDNTEQDIGQDGSGNLDTASLLSFAGAGSAYVKTIYDQKSTNHLSQTTSAAQPRIVNAGVLETFPGGRPRLVFDGSDDFMSAPPFGIPAPLTRIMVSQFISVASGQNVSSDGVGSSMYFSASGSLATYAGLTAVFKTGIPAGDFASTIERISAGAGGDGTYNGVATSTSPGNSGMSRPVLGGTYNGSSSSAFSNSAHGEFVVFAALTDPQVSTAVANLRTYWGLP